MMNKSILLFINKKITSPSSYLYKNREILFVLATYSLLMIWFLGRAFFTEYLAGDWVRFWVPNYSFLLGYLREGVLPFWQPYSYMGVPAALHPGYMTFYPPLLLVFALDLFINQSQSMNVLGKLLELYLYIHLLLGGMSMYVLLRKKINLQIPESFVGGFIYMFSIFSLFNLDPLLIGKMYLPLIIYLLIDFLEKRTIKSFLLWIIVNCIIFNLGYPYYIVYFFYAQIFLGVLYGFRSFILTSLGLGISGFLMSFVLLPQAYYYLQAARILETSSSAFHTTSSPFPTFLINTLIPKNFYSSHILTWGVMNLIFLVKGFINLKYSKVTVWLVVIFVFSLIMGLGGYLGIQNVLGIPPFFIDKFRSHGQVTVLTFFTGVIFVSIGLGQALKGIRNPKVELFFWYACGLITSILLLIPLLDNNYMQNYNKSLESVGVLLTLLVCGLILYHFIVKFKSKLLVIVLLGITFIEFHHYYTKTESLRVGGTYNEYFARNSLIPEIPTKDNLFRYEFWENQFMYNSTYLRTFAVGGYDGIPYAASYNITRFSAPKHWQFANVKYLVTNKEYLFPEYNLVRKIGPNEHENEFFYGSEVGYELFTSKSQNTYYIYKANNYLPRFYIPEEVKSCNDKNCYLEENPPKLVITENPNVNIRNVSPSSVTINVLKYEPNLITLQITAPKDTFVASSEIWDKGWSLKINDNDSLLYNVSNGFRGFYVPSGKSIVKMSYFPPFFLYGIVLSIISILVLITLGINKNLWMKITNKK